jgi:hypothetical protein
MDPRLKEGDAYQIRRYDRDNTVTPGWGEWETVTRQKYDDVCAYIEMGYLFYQARSLTCSHAVCHKLSPPDDCPGTQEVGIAKEFRGNPFAFRK